MPARNFEEFMHLKNQEVSTVTKKNAESMFENIKSELIESLETLTVGNITQVENLYLLVAQLKEAAALLSVKKVEEKVILLDHGLKSTPLYAQNIFNEALSDASIRKNFSKFIAIDKQYKPSKEGWADVHETMLLTVHHHIKTTLIDYYHFLEGKIVEYEIAGEQAPETLKARRNAIHKAKTVAKKGVLTAVNLNLLRTHTKICLENNPHWLEKPFIQNMIEAIGLKPIYKKFFSKGKEQEFQNALEQILDPKIK